MRFKASVVREEPECPVVDFKLEVDSSGDVCLRASSEDVGVTLLAYISAKTGKLMLCSDDEIEELGLEINKEHGCIAIDYD